MEKKFKIGDLVSCNANSIFYYAKVVSIIKYKNKNQVIELVNGLTENDTIYEHINECDVITGWVI